jgi:DnaK suppressor protein
MERTDIERFKRKLELQRQEILPFLSQLEHETRSLDEDSVQDIADQSVITLSKESLFERSSQRRTLLRLVEAALRRIAAGSFGVCVGCGNDIQLRRLEALPWTQFCLRCQEAIEKEVGAALSAHVSVHSGSPLRRAG